MPTVENIESEIRRAVDHALDRQLRALGVLPPGYRCVVRLQGPNRDKKRTAAFERNWDPDDDSIRIEFEEIDGDAETIEADRAADRAARNVVDPVIDMIGALDRAEARPGYDFVSLKLFRDAMLPSENFAWAETADARHDVIREAIDRRLVLTHKVPNPKSPQFPVTAIRLNRSAPEVQKALGLAGARAPVFRPVAIRGEPLSTSVMRDRR